MNAEAKFASSNESAPKNSSSLFDFSTSAESSTTNDLQKGKTNDPFSFNDQQPSITINTSNSNQTSALPSSDSSKLYDLYKGGNFEPIKIKTTANGPNYSGGQSNYAYLDMLTSQQNQQKSI